MTQHLQGEPHRGPKVVNHSQTVYLCIAFVLDVDVNVQPKKFGNPDEWGPYFQGDIIMLPEQRNGVIDTSYRWPNGQVAYVYDIDFGK